MAKENVIISLRVSADGRRTALTDYDIEYSTDMNEIHDPDESAHRDYIVSAEVDVPEEGEHLVQGAVEDAPPPVPEEEAA